MRRNICCCFFSSHFTSENSRAGIGNGSIKTFSLTPSLVAKILCSKPRKHLGSVCIPSGGVDRGKPSAPIPNEEKEYILLEYNSRVEYKSEKRVSVNDVIAHINTCGSVCRAWQGLERFSPVWPELEKFSKIAPLYGWDPKNASRGMTLMPSACTTQLSESQHYCTAHQGG